MTERLAQIDQEYSEGLKREIEENPQAYGPENLFRDIVAKSFAAKVTKKQITGLPEWLSKDPKLQELQLEAGVRLLRDKHYFLTVCSSYYNQSTARISRLKGVIDIIRKAEKKGQRSQAIKNLLFTEIMLSAIAAPVD